MFTAVILEDEKTEAKSAFQVSAVSEILGNPDSISTMTKLGKLILTTPQKFEVFSHFGNTSGFSHNITRDTITIHRASYEIVGLSRDDFMKYARQEVENDPTMREVRLYGDDYKALFPK